MENNGIAEIIYEEEPVQKHLDALSSVIDENRPYVVLYKTDGGISGFTNITNIEKIGLFLGVYATAVGEEALKGVVAGNERVIEAAKDSKKREALALSSFVKGKEDDR